MSDAAAPSLQLDQIKLIAEHKHQRPLTSCHWDPTSKYIFFGAEDHQVHRWDTTAKTAVAWDGHDSWVRAFGSSPDGQFLFTGGYDGRWITWRAAAEQAAPVRVVDAHQGWVRALAVSPSGEWVATCGNDRLIKLWNAATGALVREFTGHASHVYNVIFSKDGTTLYSCDLKGTVRAWMASTGEGRELVTVAALHGYDTTFRADIGGARGIALRDDNSQLALGGITNVSNAFAGVGEIAVALVKLADGKLDQVLAAKAKTKGTVWGVAYHPSGYWIGLSGGGDGGFLTFWKDANSPEAFQYKLKNDGRGLSLAPNRAQAAVAHADQHLRVYGVSG